MWWSISEIEKDERMQVLSTIYIEQYSPLIFHNLPTDVCMILYSLYNTLLVYVKRETRVLLDLFRNYQMHFPEETVLSEQSENDSNENESSDYMPPPNDMSPDEENQENEKHTICSDEEEDKPEVCEKFKVFITPDEWVDIPILSDSRGDRRLGGQWTQILSSKIGQFNPFCPMSFKRNRVKRLGSRKSKGCFFLGKAVCKFNNCSKYTITIKKKPKPGKNSTVRFTLENSLVKINHERNVYEGRNISGEKRKEIGEEARISGPSSTYYKRMGSVQEDVFKSGNKSEFGTKDVIRKIASECKLAEKLHQNVFVELGILKEVFEKTEFSKQLKGRIQHLSVYPFTVYLYSEKQLSILNDHCKKGSGVLYFDATGEVVAKIPDQSKRVYYYPLLLKGSRGQPPLPVAEMLSNSHTTVDVTTFFLTIMRDLNRLFSNAHKPSRIEIDFSWPFIHAILFAFNNETLLIYLNKSWNSISNNTAMKDETIIHICSAHILHRIAGTVSKQTKDKNLKRFIMYIFSKIINSKSKDHIDQLFEYLCILLLSKTESDHPNYKTAKVYLDKLITTAEDPDKEMQEDEYEEKDEVDSNTKQISQSVFATHYNGIYERVKDSMLGLNSDITNPYYSVSTVEYILKTYMPLVPLWSGLLLPENLHHDTTSPAELWMKIVKRDTLQGKMRHTPGRFILNLYEVMEGRLREFTMTTEKKLPASTSSYCKEEKWGGQTKKKKGIYFKTPSKSPVPKKRKSTKLTEKSLHWGGSIRINDRDITLANTCPIDNFLVLIHELLKRPIIQEYFKDNQENVDVCRVLLQVDDLFKSGFWTEGRAVWIIKYLKEPIGDVWDLWGSEAEYFVQYFTELQAIKRGYICSKRRCLNKVTLETNKEIILGANSQPYISLQNSLDVWQKGIRGKCSEGENICTGYKEPSGIEFTNDPPPILVLSVSLLSQINGLSYKDLPTTLQCFGDNFKVFGFTVCVSSHFKAYFKREDKWFSYNGLNDPEITEVDTPSEDGLMEHLILTRTK